MISRVIRNAVNIALLALATGCSGGVSSTYEKTVTDLAKTNVVSGMVYGYRDSSLKSVTSSANVAADYISLSSGQYAISNYPHIKDVHEDVFAATFADGQKLYSVWSGTPLPVADITSIYSQSSSVYPSEVKASPDDLSARININPLTDMAYWLWLSENRSTPYYDHMVRVVNFFATEFSDYNLVKQDAVKDYPSAEILRVLQDYRVEISDDRSSFILMSRKTGTPKCKGQFATFPQCY